MSEFQKSLVRFLYVALVLAAVISVWGATRPGAGSAAVGGAMLDSGRRGVTATGTCIVRTKPELCDVTLGVWQSSKTARAAKDFVKSTSRKIIQALKQAGVAQKDIQTQRFHLASNWRSGKNWSGIVWNADESLRVRIRKIDSVADVVDLAVKSGANRIGGLEYSVDDVNALRAKGRAKASEVARTKARELATSLGGSLGRLVTCSEGYPGDYDSYGGSCGDSYGGWNYGYALRRMPQANVQMGGGESAGSSATEELTIQPGEMVTTVVVTATYELK